MAEAVATADLEPGSSIDWKSHCSGSTRSSVALIAAVTAAQSAGVIGSATSGVAAPSDPSGSVGAAT